MGKILCIFWFLEGVLGSLVSWFLGSLVVKFLGFKVSSLLGSKVSKIYHISISCFLQDIDPISAIFKNLLVGSSDMFGARLFQYFQNVGCPTLSDFTKHSGIS